MTLYVNLSDVCDGVILKLSGMLETLGIPDNGLFYGDQERIPVSPCICVEPNEKRADLYGAGRMTEVFLTVYLLVYHSEIRSAADNRRDADKLAEAIATLLNADGTFGGKAIHCYVTNIQSGYSTKSNTTLRSSRITFEVQSQERLPQNP